MRRLYLALALLVLLLGSCEIRKPVLPEWDVTLNVPLMNSMYFVSDLVDSVNIVLSDGDVLTLRGTGSISTPPLGAITTNPNFQLAGIPILSGVEMTQKIPFGSAQDDFCLSYGEIESGLIGISFDDIAVPPSILQLSILELKRADGASFTVNYEGESGWADYGLGGWRVGTQNSGVLLDSLTIKISSQSSLPTGTPLGSFGFRANTPIGFGYFQGSFRDYSMPLQENSSKIEIDYPLGIENAIQLQQASLMISLTNQLGFKCDFYGDLYAENTRNGTTETIPIVDNNGNPYLVSAATTAGASTTDLVFEKNLSRLLQIMPDVIQIQNARFVMKCSNESLGFAHSSDTISGRYQVDAPFTFTLHESEIRTQDPIKLEVSKDNRDMIRKNARSADLSLLIKNRLPIGFKADLYLGHEKNVDPADSISYFLHREVVLRSKQWSDANLPPSADGFQELQLSLSEAEMQMFDSPELYLLWSFSFEESSEVVSITASLADYIQIKSMIKLGLRVKEIQ